MKSVLFLVAVFLFPSFMCAQSIDTRRYIEVDGTAKLLAEPDLGRWSIQIRGEAATLAEASASLESSGQSLIDALDGEGFDPSILRLSAISSGRIYESTREGRVMKGYYAERSAVLELKDLLKRQSLESLLLHDDQVEIRNVSTESTEHEELRRQVLLNAAAAAKSKAKALAETLDAKLGPVLSIEQGNAEFRFQTSNMVNIAASAPGIEEAELEKLTYQATVKVKFELQ
ncbi:MAG: hypothetical protein CMO55_01750 [Verrucomicrobiales bacterium]|nr:hypothetical protein [Verrucomicrobiales bacterium]